MSKLPGYVVFGIELCEASFGWGFLGEGPAAVSSAMRSYAPKMDRAHARRLLLVCRHELALGAAVRRFLEWLSAPPGPRVRRRGKLNAGRSTATRRVP